ncbi:MAG: 3-keto-disaccharide hydrolase [Akkermansiaceae bacterium]
MKLPLLVTVFSAALTTLSCFADEGFVPLFDGETLEGWTAARSKEAKTWGPFSVNKEEKAIHVYAGKEADSKQANDCLVSDKPYSHFILKLEYKWLGKRFAPRTTWDRDAGLLFHVHGNLKKVWPLSVEMQIGESPADKPNGRKAEGRFHTGDLFVLGKHLLATTKHTDGHWDPNGEEVEVRFGPTKLGTEKPFGEWNQMEIQVHGSEKAVFILNDEVVYEISNITQKVAGVVKPLEKGHIGLQAEWAELLYRNIMIKELPQSDE